MALQAINLKSFIKLTGGKGLHVVVPITRRQDFSVIKIFTKQFAEKLEKQFPELFTSNMKKEKRKGKIFIDYLRNEYGATAVAVFSPRARENATIAVPVTWEKLAKSKKIISYTIKTLGRYLKDYPEDPWKDFLKTKQSITKQHLAMFRNQ